jgi:hypothetical protein
MFYYNIATVYELFFNMYVGFLYEVIGYNRRNSRHAYE